MNRTIPVRRVTGLGLAVALAVALQLAEQLIPVPLPWLRPGLANIVTLVILVEAGTGAALLVTLGRYAVVMLAGGLTLGWGLGVGGGFAAWGVMAFLHTVGRNRLGLLSLSATGACAHLTAQFVMLSLWLRLDLLWSQLALALPFAYLTGLLTGFLAWLVLTTLADRVKISP